MHDIFQNTIDSSYMVCWKLFLIFFHIITSRPGLFLSALPEFFKKGKLFQQFLPERAPKSCGLPHI